MRKFIIFLFLYLTFERAISMVESIPVTPHYKQLYISKSDELVALVSNGVVRSTDHGENWERVLKHDTYKTSYILAKQAQGLILIPDNGTIYYSSDEGKSWVETGKSSHPEVSIKLFGQRANFNSLIDDNGIIYVCERGKLYLSTNGGATWHITNYSTSENQACKGIAVLKNVIYILMENSLISSNNRGLTWGAVQVTNFDVKFNSGEVVFMNGGVKTDTQGRIYVQGKWGVLISSDNGLSWENFKITTNEKVTFQLYFLRPDALYVSSNENSDSQLQHILYRSYDMNELVKFHHFYPWEDVQADSTGAIYVVTRTAIHKTSDIGSSWQTLKTKGISW